MDCPWSFLSAAPAEFCEASLCAWIREPANTWSNAGFLIAAAVVYWMATKPRWSHLRMVAHISLITGVGSAFFHATETVLGEGGDYFGMYMGSAFMLCVCFRRWTGAGARASQFFFWSYFAALFAAYLLFREHARLVFMITGGICSLLDVSLAIRDRKVLVWRWLFLMWALFTAAFWMWNLDVSGQWCHPDNHLFNGHAAWHLLNAAAFLASVRYYEQFKVLRPN